VTGWRTRAACAGQHDLFFDGRREAAARAVCAGCPVRRECAEFAITSAAEFGVWAGMGESDLRGLRGGQQRRAPAVRVSRPRGPYRKAA
jgi:WhiB family redox-sensing transcriptional regulator